MLEISDLAKRFGDTTVLNGINLHVEQGEFLALVGPSGSGKTTLLRIIAGFEEADLGTIRLRDQVVVQDRRALAPERRRIGMVFQDYALFPHLSVRENVAFGLPRGSARNAMIEQALESVEMLRWIDAMPHELSGGQQQRIALARALAPEPGIILMDEPFSNLDPALRAQVRSDVRRILHDAGVTTMLVTHDQEEALSIADRVAVLRHGNIAQIGSPREVYHAPSSEEVASFVGDAQFFRGTIHQGTIETPFGVATVKERIGDGELVTVMVRPEMVALMPAASTSDNNLRVEEIEFFGRDQRVLLSHGSGEKIVARIAPDAVYRQGQEVTIRFTQPLHALPNGHAKGEA